MEMTAILRYICLCAALQLVNANSSYSDWLRLSSRAEESEGQQQQNEDLDDFGSNLISPGKPKRCCKNGGICIMNSFCHCKKNYYGRYCQHRVKHRACGTIPHGTWLSAACNICHCYDGQMICKAADFPNCGDTFEDGHETEPDYQGGIEKDFEDYEKFYDDYETHKNNGAPSVNSITYWMPFMVVTSFRSLGLVS